MSSLDLYLKDFSWYMNGCDCISTEKEIGVFVNVTESCEAIEYTVYNGKIWRGLNLVNPSSEHLGEFLIWQRPIPDRKVWQF